ncbi:MULTISPECIES: hypothetical protein, partial [unclassified Cryobacterium]|uniref:hypothetical protein n=1 Tax=unclassified Cryobacterium TaxID=2649013 RepID=UPI002E123722
VMLSTADAYRTVVIASGCVDRGSTETSESDPHRTQRVTERSTTMNPSLQILGLLLLSAPTVVVVVFLIVTLRRLKGVKGEVSQLRADLEREQQKKHVDLIRAPPGWIFASSSSFSSSSHRVLMDDPEGETS